MLFLFTSIYIKTKFNIYLTSTDLFFLTSYTTNFLELQELMRFLGIFLLTWSGSDDDVGFVSLQVFGLCADVDVVLFAGLQFRHVVGKVLSAHLDLRE